MIENAADINNGDVVIKQNGKLVKPSASRQAYTSSNQVLAKTA